jgi:polygalacturonase
MQNINSRRNFLKRTGQGLLAVPVLASIGGFKPVSDIIIPEEKVTVSGTDNPILSLNVRDYGAKGDSITNDTAAIQQTIDRCYVLGGGCVVVPTGNYLTGAIQLRSNISLLLEKDSILCGVPEFSSYPVMQVRWEGKWIQGYTALIYATDSENITIKGSGRITGNYGLGGRPSKDNPLRHPALIEPINCKNILFEGFSTDYYLMWSIHPTYCENVSIRNVTIRSTGGNGDGIDIDSCKNVLIENCDIATGDDCIAIKSGRGMEGYVLLKTTENVTIRNCKLSDSIFACIGIGSETSGGIRNVLIENCTFYNSRTHAIYIKSRPGRGAFIENITARNLDVSGMEGGFLRINVLKSGIQDPFPVPELEGIPSVRNFTFSKVKVENVAQLIEGTLIHPDKPLDGLVIEEISGSCTKGIELANIKNASLKKIDVTVGSGPLITVSNVTGRGLEKAAEIAFPHKLQDMITKPEVPFELK